jgi:hypothetical protein
MSRNCPSGVRTITGVATSITAFDRAHGDGARRSDRSQQLRRFRAAVRLVSDPAYPMSYSVRDFFQNGGARR